jgi:transcriptional regulator with XRE-family HTH domain
MQPAQFKTLREALGFTLAEVAALAGVGERTAKYWESSSEPPADVVQVLKNWDAAFDQAAHNALAVYAEQSEENGLPEGVDLYRYREAATLWAQHPEFEGLSTRVHAVLLWRVKHALQLAGIVAVIRFVD